MSFENKITDKLNEVSMMPSSDIMSMVRKKRTPFYIFKNHLSLHKVRYGAVAVLGLLALSAPFVLDTSKNAETIVVKDSGNNNTTILESEDNKEVAQSLNAEDETSPFETGTNAGESKGDNKGAIELKRTEALVQSSDRRNFSAERKDRETGHDKSPSKVFGEKVKDEKGKLLGKGEEIVNSNDVSDKNQRELDRREFVQMERILVPIANIEYLENKRELEDRTIVSKANIPVKDLKKIGVNFIGIGAGYYYDHNLIVGGTMGYHIKESLGKSSSTSYGLSIGLSLYKKWTLQTGVEVFTRKEDFSYLKRSENYVLKIDTVNGKIHIPGQPDKDVVRYDSTYHNDGKHQRFAALNKTSYVELPIVLSYNLFTNRKLKIGVNPGLRLGLLQAQTGLTLNEIYSPVNIKSEGSVNQHKSINLSAELGLDFDYKLAPGVNFFLQPKVRRGVGNLMEDKAGFEKSNTSFGVFSGIRFQLN